jgi:hypothetical protein
LKVGDTISPDRLLRSLPVSLKVNPAPFDLKTDAGQRLSTILAELFISRATMVGVTTCT